MRDRSPPGRSTPTPAASLASPSPRRAQSIVTANVAGKTATVTVALNPRTGISLTAPTTSVSAGQPASFYNRHQRPGQHPRRPRRLGRRLVTVAGRDQRRDDDVAYLQQAGTFVVTATAVDTSGASESVSTSVTVLPAQPPSVIVQPSTATPVINENVILRAQVSGNTSSILRYEWNFGSGVNGPQTLTTTGNQVQVSWSTIGSKTIFVTVFQATGPSGDGFGSVSVRAAVVGVAEVKK